VRNVDGKGRVSLGRAFADKLVIVEELADGAVQVTPATAIPEREAWLYRNADALASVRAGLQQAANGELVEGPDLDVKGGAKPWRGAGGGIS